ncbi:MAG: PIN domain-containing protein [Dethiobacter sp.]|nr:PIN domain-containing protein [Dethiobacter sp.]
MILVDTNVLVYAVNESAPKHQASRRLIEGVQGKTVPGVLFPQILLEFYAIVTNRKRFEQPLEPPVARKQVEALRSFFPVISCGTETLDILFGETTKGETGSGIFDAYLVAQMKASGIATICTYNTAHFICFKQIVVKTPEEVMAMI